MLPEGALLSSWACARRWRRRMQGRRPSQARGGWADRLPQGGRRFRCEFADTPRVPADRQHDHRYLLGFVAPTGEGYVHARGHAPPDRLSRRRAGHAGMPGGLGLAGLKLATPDGAGSGPITPGRAIRH
ncbi:MAG: hypothetical protein ACLQDY_06620 [Streptosporangiaceae bacterium]